jgi:phospholipid/cholesterol/gamma-HCH transport system substrate-binding protein
MRGTTNWRRTAAPALLAWLLLVVGGCGWSGVNNRPLPFAKGNGSGAITVTVEMANAVNLVPNSEVKVDDVTVGSVRHIEMRDWHAVLSVGLEKGTHLPANALARIGQKSLLGAEYLEIAVPTTGAPVGSLKSGAVIPLSRTGRYPETEELFAALSTVLNGGGLSQMGTITTELNKALNGRESDVRDLVSQLSTLIGRLDAQRTQIVTAMEGLNRLSSTFARERPALTRALATLPRAVDVLRRERPKLTQALTRLGTFGQHTTQLLRTNQATLHRNLAHLRPVLGQLADAGDSLTNALSDATFPFPLEGLIKSAKGDYLNLFLTVDLTTKAINRDLLGGISPLDAVYGGLTGVAPSKTATGATDPLGVPKSLTVVPRVPKVKAKTPVKPPRVSSGDSSDSGNLLKGLTGGLF